MKTRLGIIIIALSLLVPHLSWGACGDTYCSGSTCTTADAERATVAAAVAEGKTCSGNVTVNVAAGTATWTTAIALDGAGATATSISVIGAASNSTIISLNPVTTRAFTLANGSTYPMRISGFKFINTDTSNATGYMITSSGTISNLRIDNNYFEGSGYSGSSHIMYLSGRVTGVIDSNTFHNTGYGVMYPCSDGNAAWATPVTFGSSDALYIEHNTFTQTFSTDLQNAIDADTGARYVFRYNTLLNYNTGHHGYDSDPSSTYTHELYNNYITFDYTNNGVTGSWYTSSRGGTGMIFRNYTNKIGGTTPRSEHTFRLYRTEPTICASYQSCCNGTQAADGNDVVDSGTHTGADSTTVLTSSAAEGWTTNAWVSSAIFNTTNSSSCLITANDATTITCSGGLSGGNSWHATDTFELKTGYPCHQQNGRGENDGLEPVYLWSNVNGPLSYGPALAYARSALFIQQGRDYYNDDDGGITVGTSLPGTCTPLSGYFKTDEGSMGKLYVCTATNTWTEYYTPYTCPHPLTGLTAGTCGTTAGTGGYLEGGGSPPAGPNLQAGGRISGGGRLQ